MDALSVLAYINNVNKEEQRAVKDQQMANALVEFMGMKSAPPETMLNQQGIKQIEQEALTPTPERPFVVNAPQPAGLVQSLPVNKEDAINQRRNTLLEQIAGSESGQKMLTSVAQQSMMPKQKEFNTPGDLDTFLASKYPYTTEKDRMLALNEFRKPEVANEFVEWKRKVATPFFTAVPTSEGLVAFNARSGKPEGKTGYDKPLTNEMITASQQINTLKESLGRVKAAYKPEYVGPVAGRMGSLKESTTGVPKEQAGFYADSEQIKNTLIYLMSGKQINETEYDRLLKQLPDRNLPSVVFEERMKRFDDTLNSIIKERERASGGYGVPKAQTSASPKNDMSDIQSAAAAELARRRKGK